MFFFFWADLAPNPGSQMYVSTFYQQSYRYCWFFLFHEHQLAAVNHEGALNALQLLISRAIQLYGVEYSRSRYFSLQWCHNGRDGVSNHRRLYCLFRRRSKKSSKLSVADLYEGNSPVTGESPSQRASNAENISIWWRHHVYNTTHRKTCCGFGMSIDPCFLW